MSASALVINRGPLGSMCISLLTQQSLERDGVSEALKFGDDDGAAALSAAHNRSRV
jgi:hypothetical protein